MVDVMGCNPTPRALRFMDSTLGVVRQGPGRVSPSLPLFLFFSFSLIIFKALMSHHKKNRSNWLLKSLALWAVRVKVNGYLLWAFLPLKGLSTVCVGGFECFFLLPAPNAYWKRVSRENVVSSLSSGRVKYRRYPQIPEDQKACHSFASELSLHYEV